MTDPRRNPGRFDNSYQNQPVQPRSPMDDALRDILREQVKTEARKNSRLGYAAALVVLALGILLLAAAVVAAWRLALWN